MRAVRYIGRYVGVRAVCGFVVVMGHKRGN